MVLKTSFAPYKLKRERRIHLLSKQWVKAAPIKFFVVKYSRTCAKCVCFVSAVPQPLVLYSAVFMFFFLPEPEVGEINVPYRVLFYSGERI